MNGQRDGQIFQIFQAGSGHWAVYYTSPQSLIITFSYSLISWGFLLNFDWLVHLVECPNVSTTNRNLKTGLFCVSSLGMNINLSAIVLALDIPEIKEYMNKDDNIHKQRSKKSWMGISTSKFKVYLLKSRIDL